MTPLQSVLVDAVLFLLRRYVITVGWVPDGEPMHDDKRHKCPCEACGLMRRIEMEAS